MGCAATGWNPLEHFLEGKGDALMVIGIRFFVSATSPAEGWPICRELLDRLELPFEELRVHVLRYWKIEGQVEVSISAGVVPGSGLELATICNLMGAHWSWKEELEQIWTAEKGTAPFVPELTWAHVEIMPEHTLSHTGAPIWTPRQGSPVGTDKDHRR